MKRWKLALLGGVSVLLSFGQDKQTTIPAGSRVFVESSDGFDIYLMKALEKKQVPLSVVGDKDKADYVISSFSEHSDRHTLKTDIIGNGKKQSIDEASLKLVNKTTGAIVFTDTVRKVNGLRGRQSAVRWTRFFGQKKDVS